MATFETIKLKHNTPEWLDFRKSGIGASEAAAVMGMSNWLSNMDLWEIKVGLKEPKDLSEMEYVEYGSKAEQHLVELFKLQYKNRYKVKVNKSVVYRKDGFQFASLDGELEDLQTKELGIYEGKTVEAISSLTWEEWKEKPVQKVPQQYYVQCLHQLLVTGRQFVILRPEFRWTDKDGEIRTSCRSIPIRREEVEADLKALDEAEHEFWNYVTKRERPPRLLPQI